MQNSNDYWITTKELAQIKGISERAVRKAISKNKYVIRKCSKSYEILVTSLEENVREKVTSNKEKSELLKNLLHPNQLNIGKAIKYTKMALIQRGFTNLCCDLTYRRFANNYKNEHYNVWIEAREGNKALHDKVLPYITRDVSKLEVGDLIVGDGHKLAFFVKHPYKGTYVRPTLVAYQDWKSGGFVGFEIMLEENTQCIASALRNSVMNLGKVPKFVYQDNGKAFKAKYFIENGITGLFTNLGIQPIYAKPYNA